MKPVAVVAALALVGLTAGCGGSSGARHPVAVASTPLAPLPTTEPLPLTCPVPDEPGAGAAGSALTFTGACAFSERGIVPCPNNKQNQDDYYIRFTRTMSPELTIYVSMNVERYHGPGRYAGTTAIIVEIPDRTTIYEWSTSTGTVTINPDGTSGRIERTQLGPAVGTPTKGTEYVEGSFTCRH